MKKTVLKVIALTLVAIMMVGTLAACAKTLSGEYSSTYEVAGQSITTTYKFKGKNVEIETKTVFLGNINTEKTEATYEINENADGTLEITFFFEEDGETDSKTYTFEEEDEYIKIGGSQYNKN